MSRLAPGRRREPASSPAAPSPFEPIEPIEPVQPDAPALRGTILMNQDWCDLTYLHWAIEPERVAHLMPPGVRPDVHEGVTYVGLVLFRMVDAGFGRRSSVPYFGSFLETNVRLYSVDAQGRRGVVFLSLDADRLAVVLAARAGFAVPYRWARMSYARSPHELGTRHAYTAELRWPGVTARSRVSIAAGEEREPSALDDFVSARWRLHTRLAGRTLRIPNEHQRWPLHDATLLDLDDELVASVGLPGLADRAPDHLAFSPGVHTRFGLPQRVRLGDA